LMVKYKSELSGQPFAEAKAAIEALIDSELGPVGEELTLRDEGLPKPGTPAEVQSRHAE